MMTLPSPREPSPHVASGGPPRWVVLFGLAAIVLVVIVFAVHLSGGMAMNHVAG